MNSYTRFFVEGTAPDMSTMLDGISLRAFRPLKPSDEEPEHFGWCSPDDPLDLDLSYAYKIAEGDFIRLGLRVDRYRLPGAILKAHMREAEIAMLAELGRARLTRTQKEDLRAMVERKLREQTLPTMRVYEVTWDTKRAVLRFSGTTAGACNALCELFEKSFGIELVRESAYTRAEHLLEPGQLDDLTATQPLVMHRDDHCAPIGDRRMDRGERIEHCTFLGREFLLYLWWKSATAGGDFALEGHGDIGLGLESSIVLERKIDVIEQTRMKGAAPASTCEAKEALRRGKLPTQGRLRLTAAERDYVCTFIADEVAVRSVKLPALLTEEEDDRFTEQMALLGTFEAMLDALFREYLVLRISPAFRDETLPALRAWGEAS